MSVGLKGIKNAPIIKPQSTQHDVFEGNWLFCGADSGCSLWDCTGMERDRKCYHATSEHDKSFLCSRRIRVHRISGVDRGRTNPRPLLQHRIPKTAKSKNLIGEWVL